LTGQASNILGAALVAKLVNVEVTWSSWFVAAIVPGLASCLAVPWVVYRVLPPEIQRTPEAAEFARSELVAMGRMQRHEVTALAVFAGVALLWITSGWHGLDVTMVAMAGMMTLLLTGTLQWKQVVGESSAWEVFIWYGGLLRMGELLNNTGLTKVFAEHVGTQLTGLPWMAVLLLTLLVFFYAHYFFASITAHMLAMLPPFVVLVVAVGVPPMLAVFSMLCLANLTAGLTHYGTTTGPIFFSQNYVSFGDWWRTGFIVSVANLVIWLTIGFFWWRVLGHW
jgi:DASS family divalent anion:Na+ symporter